jgi:hypothetical protein
LSFSSPRPSIRGTDDVVGSAVRRPKSRMPMELCRCAKPEVVAHLDPESCARPRRSSGRRPS